MRPRIFVLLGSIAFGGSGFPSSAGATPASAMLQVVSITGVVRDTSGVPLPNAQVIIPALNRGTTTNGNGEFTFRAIPAGTYHLISQMIGYAPGHADATVPPGSGAPVRVTITARPTPLTLTSVQITATPTGTDPRELTQSTVAVADQALARSLSATVAQSLANEPGISASFNGPAAAMPVIRGLTGERVLVLHDGQRASDLSATSPDHAVSVDPLTAERIEVVRGPASLLYGNNALGGVVNVISNDIPTEVPSHVEGYFAGQAESATPGGGVSAGLTVPVGARMALVARGGGRNVGDLRQGDQIRLPNTALRNWYGTAGLGVVGDQMTGGILYRAYRFDYGLPSADDEGIEIEGRRAEVSGLGDFSFARSGFTSLRVGGTAQWYTHDEIEATGEIGTNFRLRTQTLDVLGRTQVGSVSGAVGISGLFKQYSATGEEALTPAANSTGIGGFIYQEVPLALRTDPDSATPRLQLGARYDRYVIISKTGDPKFVAGRTLSFDNVSGSVGISIPIGRGASFAVSAARAFRAPTVEELFSNAVHEAAGTFDRGNPSLEPEVNQGFDGILRFERARAHAQVAAYYNRIDNFITPDIIKDTTITGDGGEEETLPLNQFTQSAAILRGFEGRTEVEVARNLVLGAMGDVVRGDFRDGGPLPFIPAARIGALARWDNGRYNAGVEMRHAFAQEQVPAAATIEDPSAVSTGAYDLVNLSMGTNMIIGGRVHEITLRADNLLDEQYREATSRIKNFAFNSGRNFSLVYRLLF